MSTLKVDSLQTTSGGGLYPAKAWVNFNGTGAVAIRADGDVSSITDSATGRYVVNFTNSFSNSSYCPTLGFGTSLNVNVHAVFGNSSSTPTITTSSCSYKVVSSSYYDADFCMLSATEQ